MTDNDSDAPTLEQAALAQRHKAIEKAPGDIALDETTAETGKDGATKGIWMGRVAAGIGSAALVAALMYAKRRK